MTSVAPVKLLPVMVTRVPPAAGPLVGLIVLTIGAVPPVVYVNWSDVLVADVPLPVVTRTSTVPLPAGLVDVISVFETGVNAAAVPPNVTEVAPLKLSPLMVTAVPPAGGPLLGLTPETTGDVPRARI